MAIGDRLALAGKDALNLKGLNYTNVPVHLVGGGEQHGEAHQRLAHA